MQVKSDKYCRNMPETSGKNLQEYARKVWQKPAEICQGKGTKTCKICQKYQARICRNVPEKSGKNLQKCMEKRHKNLRRMPEKSSIARLFEDFKNYLSGEF